MSELCEHETFKDVCGICHRDGVITRLRAENERLRAALRAAFDAGSELGWDHATYGERGGPEPIGHEDAFAAFLAALDGQPAPGKEGA